MAIIDNSHLTSHLPTIQPNPQVTVNGAKVFGAGKDLVFPAATVHMSAAVVKLGEHTMVRWSAHARGSIDRPTDRGEMRASYHATPYPYIYTHIHTLPLPQQVDEAVAKFAAKGTAPTQAARSTALMVLNEDQLAADKLGCTMGTYLRSYGRMCVWECMRGMAWYGRPTIRSPSAFVLVVVV